MPVNEKEEAEKLYYSISEVSEQLDLNASTIRFWEKEFEMLSPAKNKKGNRSYTKKDIDYLKKIVELIKQKGFTIEGAKKQLKAKAGSKNNNEEVIARLKEIKAKLIDLRDSEE